MLGFKIVDIANEFSKEQGRALL